MNFVDFRIAGTDINVNEITQRLNVNPKISYKKGDQIVYKGEIIKYDEDCWIASIEIIDINEMETAISDFVDLFYKHSQYIKQLSNNCNITLWITVYQEQHQFNLHFSKDVLRKISELGIEMDITSMNLHLS